MSSERRVSISYTFIPRNKDKSGTRGLIGERVRAASWRAWVCHPPTTTGPVPTGPFSSDSSTVSDVIDGGESLIQDPRAETRRPGQK